MMSALRKVLKCGSVWSDYDFGEKYSEKLRLLTEINFLRAKHG